MFHRMHVRIDHVIDHVLYALLGSNPLGTDMNEHDIW